MSLWEKPWCIGGDFITIQYPIERSRDTRHSLATLDLAYFIFEQGLMDIYLLG
jgi:hypothetical protein